MRLLMFGLSDKPGGLETVIYPMLSFFHDAGIDVDFVNAFPGPLFRESWLNENGSVIYRLNLRRRGRLNDYRRSMDTFFKSVSSKYDALWMNINEPDNGDLLFYAKKYGIRKRIVVGHSSAPFQVGGRIRRLSIRLSRALIRRYATSMIGVSKLAGRYAFARGFSVIHSGIDVARFKYAVQIRSEMRSKLGVGTSTKLLICVARFVASKNHSFLIDIFRNYLEINSDSLLLLVGDGELKSSVTAYAEQLGVLSRILILSGISDPSPFLAAADYFVFPSRHEGMGMSLIEAQCSGLRCFASENVIPKEAEIWPGAVTWLPLSLSAMDWAKTIDRCKPNVNREEAYLGAVGFDVRTSALAYAELLLANPK